MIVFCHLLNDNSGSPVILREAIRALSGEEMTNNMLFVGSQGRGILEEAGIPIHRYWYRRCRLRLFTLFTWFASQVFLYRALSRAKLPQDVMIYVNTLLPFGAAIWARRHHRPLLYHIHESSISPRLLRAFLVRIVETCADRILYVSTDNRERLSVPSVPSRVVLNPVAPSIADQGFATAYAARRSGRFEVLMLASPRDFKGVPEFIDLASRLRHREDIHFTLVLNANAREIAEYFSGRSVGDNVCVHPRTNMPSRFYATADVLLNLSRPDLCIETFGLTIVEGMAFGLPVIVPPVGGPAEIVTEAKEGYLVDSRDGPRIASLLQFLADHPHDTQAMSDAARHRARDFTIKRFSRDLRAEIANTRAALSAR